MVNLTPEIQKLKRARLKAKITVDELAALSDVHRTTLFAMFAGKKTSAKTIEKVAEALGFTVTVKVGRSRNAA